MSNLAHLGVVACDSALVCDQRLDTADARMAGGRCALDLDA